jgi:predicted enzyme related to lactoylglutathione lyase
LSLDGPLSQTFDRKMKKTLPQTIHCMSPQLVVSDIGRSIQFYTKQLEFSLNFRHEDSYADVGFSGNSIHLKLGAPSKEEQERKRENEDVDIVFGVTDLDGLYETVKSKEIDIVLPLRVMPYGKEFYIRDPDGHVLAFFDVTS